MNFLIYIQKNFYKFYLIFSLAILALMVILIFKTFYSFKKTKISFINKPKENLNLIKRIFEKGLFFKEIKRKFNIISWKLKGESITIESAILMFFLFSLTLSFVLSLISGINIFLIIIPSLFILTFIFIHLIDREYMKRQRMLEKQIPEIGLIVKQFVALLKPTDIIINSLANTREKIISEEFKEVEKRYLSNHSIKSGLNSIIERYPTSILRTVVLLLEIYNEHKKDITEEIDNLVKEVEALERVKKKIEVEFARQDKTIIALIIISFIFVIFFIAFNDSFRDFYSSKRGIAIACAVLIYEICGFFLISFFKSAIIKNKKIRKVNYEKISKK